MATKITKAAMKKAIKKSDPTYLALAATLDISPITVKRFMWDDVNKDIYDLFKDKRLDTTKAAHSVIEDAIAQGDTKTSKWWIDYQRKIKEQEDGKKINLEGNLNLKIVIEDTKKKEE